MNNLLALLKLAIPIIYFLVVLWISFYLGHLWYPMFNWAFFPFVFTCIVIIMVGTVCLAIKYWD